MSYLGQSLGRVLESWRATERSTSLLLMRLKMGSADTMRWTDVGTRAIFGLLLLWVMLVPTMAFAQTAADIQAAERQAEIQQRLEQERIQRDLEAARNRGERVEGVDTKDLMPKIVAPELGVPCREIKTITINGAPHLSGAARAAITEKYTNRCLNVGDIEAILAELTRYYIDRGFVTTRAYLPPQDLSQGHLEILVIEGVVDKILIKDGGAKSVSIGNVFPGMEGKLLNLRDLEQGIDQINRLGSNNARLDIQPGDKPGESVVVVHNQPKFPLRLYVSVDNQGSESTGRTQTGATISADNLLNLNESLVFTHRESTPGDKDRKFSNSDSLSLNIPFGYTNLSLATSRSRYVSEIRVPSGLNLIASGNSKNDSVRLDRVVFRDQSSRAAVSAMVTTKESRNFLDYQLLGVSSRNLTVFDLDGNYNTGLLGGVLSLDLGYARGLNALGALNDPGYLPKDSPHAQFGKIKYGFSFSRPFRLWGRDASYTSQLSGQKAQDVLYGSEQITIGGLYSVRGFVRNTLAGDDGYYWRNEISVRQPVTVAGETVSARIYAGIDTGRVSNRAPNIPEGSLTGMAIGVATAWKGITFELFNTRPLNLPSSMSKESSQTWFRVSFSF